MRELKRMLDEELTHVVDEERRPLREHLAAPELRVGVPMRHRICGYSGSRKNHERPMNVTALEQMRAHWAEARGSLEDLHAMYFRRVGSHGTFVDTWRLAMFGRCVPEFVALRRTDREVLPVFSAAVFKMLIGVDLSLYAKADADLRKGVLALNEPVTVDELWDFIEARGLLIGPAQVCAGPENMIREILALMLGQPAVEASSSSPTMTLLGDPSRFARYAFARMAMEVLAGIFDLGCSAIGQLLASPAARASVPQALAPLSAAGAAILAQTLAPLRELPAELLERAQAMCRLGEASSELRDELDPLMHAAGIGGDDRGLVDAIVAYAQLERACAGAARILKMELAGALGRTDDAALLERLGAEHFSPPDMAVRDLLKGTHQLEFVSAAGGAVQVRAGGLHVDL